MSTTMTAVGSSSTHAVIDGLEHLIYEKFPSAIKILSSRDLSDLAVLRYCYNHYYFKNNCIMQNNIAANCMGQFDKRYGNGVWMGAKLRVRWLQGDEWMTEEGDSAEKEERTNDGRGKEGPVGIGEEGWLVEGWERRYWFSPRIRVPSHFDEIFLCFLGPRIHPNVNVVFVSGPKIKRRLNIIVNNSRDALNISKGKKIIIVTVYT